MPKPMLFSKEEFLEAVKTSKSHQEATLKLGYKNMFSVGQDSRYKKYLKELQPDITHFNVTSRSRICKTDPNIPFSFLERKFKQEKRSATHRGLEFLLTFEEFIELSNSKCYYCGGEGTTKANVRTTVLTMVCGIDRIDSKIGYIKSNCVPCCKECNYMKNKMTCDDFYNKIVQIYNNLKLGER